VLTYPIFKVPEDGQCIEVGRGSLTLLQNDSGDLYNPESYVNGYAGTLVTGTVRSSSRVNLYLNSNNGSSVSFEGTAQLGNGSILASGKATMPEFNCPESDFVLELN